MPGLLDSILLVLAVIATGWGIRFFGLVKAEEWNGFEKVAYQVVLPALIVTTLATADLRQIPAFSIALALLLPVVAVTVVLFAVRRTLARAMAIDGPAFTSVLQGAVRWNSFIALAMAGAMFGRDGLTIAALAFAVLIPVVNLVCVSALSLYGTAGKPLKAGPLALTLLRNPFVWSSLLGLAISLAAPPIPKLVLAYGDVLGRGGLAAGLLLVGSGLDLATLKRPSAAMLLASAIKLVVLPVAAGLTGLALGVTGPMLAAIIMCTGVPTAAAAYILARQAGGDAPLMASITTLQTIASAVTLPALLFIFWR